MENPSEHDWTSDMLSNLPTLDTGSHGGYVKRVQGLLYSYGVDIKADGDFDANTDGAVKTFQADRGLVSDGVVGQKTWRALVGG